MAGILPMDYFRNSIKKARKKKGLTLKQLADELGVGINTVCSWETGKANPFWNNNEDYAIKRLCKILDIDFKVEFHMNY